MTGLCMFSLFGIEIVRCIVLIYCGIISLNGSAALVVFVHRYCGSVRSILWQCCIGLIFDKDNPYSCIALPNRGVEQVVFFRV